MISATEILGIISNEIEEWHRRAAVRTMDYVIVNDDIRRIRRLNEHRDDLVPVVKELINTNCEMWHEEDKVRSKDDQTVLKAIRNINPLNQHRNDLIEEIDEIMIDHMEAK